MPPNDGNDHRAQDPEHIEIPPPRAPRRRTRPRQGNDPSNIVAEPGRPGLVTHYTTVKIEEYYRHVTLKSSKNFDYPSLYQTEYLYYGPTPEGPVVTASLWHAGPMPPPPWARLPDLHFNPGMPPPAGPCPQHPSPPYDTSSDDSSSDESSARDRRRVLGVVAAATTTTRDREWVFHGLKTKMTLITGILIVHHNKKTPTATLLMASVLTEQHP